VVRGELAAQDLGLVRADLLPRLLELGLLEEHAVHLRPQCGRLPVAGALPVAGRGLGGALERSVRQAVAPELQLADAGEPLHEPHVQRVI